MRKFTLTLFLCFFGILCFATSFSAKDGNFTISLPSKWKETKLSKNEVLNLKKGNSNIIITNLVNCNNLQCLENTLNKKIKQIKNKKLKLVKNTYSGEEIKKGEFSTLDPYLYFSYSAENVNYTEGYFLANSKGYKVELSNLSSQDADFYLSFIVPKPKETQDLPLITEEEPVMEENIIAPEVQMQAHQAPSKNLQNKDITKEKQKLEFIVSTKYSIIIMLICIYICMVIGFFVYNSIFSPTIYKKPTNPKSFYPIIGKRFYGSPDLFLQLYDSQGQNFVVISQRWSSFLKEYGFYGAIGFAFLHFIINSLNPQMFSSFLWFNMTLSLCYLFVALGLIFMLAGYVLEILFPTPIFIYTDKGKILYKIIRRSNGFFGYAYLVLTDPYTVVFRIETKKIFFIRQWALFDERTQIALIREISILKALARKLLGHLGGSLRSNYSVTGKNESKGQILSFRTITTNFQIDIDKPQAFAKDAMLAISAIIFTRNRDKFYPWFD